MWNLVLVTEQVYENTACKSKGLNLMTLQVSYPWWWGFFSHPLKICFLEIQFKPYNYSECSCCILEFFVVCFPTSLLALFLCTGWTCWKEPGEMKGNSVGTGGETVRQSHDAQHHCVGWGIVLVTDTFLQNSRCWEPGCWILQAMITLFLGVNSVLVPVTSQNGVLTFRSPNEPKDFILLTPG